MSRITKRKRPGSRPQELSAQVLLVEDHPLIRKGIGNLLNEQPGVELCGEASGVQEAMRIVEQSKPDAVIVDLILEQGNGLDLIRNLQVQHPKIRVLVFSMCDERLYAERALRAGAHGYVMKKDPPETLLDGLLAVLRGEVFISPSMANTLLNTLISGSPHADRKTGVDRLSDREVQVFDYIGRGLTSREIAECLGLSVKTVETYRGHIKRKMGLSNGNALIHAAIHWIDENGGQDRPGPAPKQACPPAQGPRSRARKR